MFVIKSESLVPPGGAFVAKHPVSGASFRHHTVDGLWRKYNEHCRANDYEEVGRQAMVQNICANTRANICEELDENSNPTPLQKVKNFAHDMAEWAKSGFSLSGEAAAERLEICEQCPYWHGLSGGKLLSGRCGKCGCNGLKLALLTTQCPVNKWGPVTQ